VYGFGTDKTDRTRFGLKNAIHRISTGILERTNVIVAVKNDIL